MSNWTLPLSPGQHHDDVALSQDLLKRLDPSFVPDPPRPFPTNADPSVPFFGPNTEAAVRAFQVDHGMAENGVVDWVTAQYLHWADELRAFDRTLYPRDPALAQTGEDVRILREWLRHWWQRAFGNLNNFPPSDGNDITYGENTGRAVETFKKSVGLSVNPIANWQVVQLLHRNRLPLTGNQQVVVRGTVKHGTDETPLRDYVIRAFAPAGEHEYYFGQAARPSDEDGQFEIRFHLDMRPPGNAGAMPIKLKACFGDFAFDEGWADSISLDNASPTIDIDFENYTIGGAAVYVDAERERPAAGVAVEAFSVSITDSKELVRTSVGTAEVDRFGSFAITFEVDDGKRPDLVVEAVDATGGGDPVVLATSSKLFNIEPVEFTVKLKLPAKTSSFPQPPEPAAGPTEFGNVVARLEGSGYVIANLANELWELSVSERTRILEFIAGDIAVSTNDPPRPPLGTVNYDNAMLEYQEGVKTRIRENVPLIEKAVRAHALAPLANAMLEAIPGFRVEVPAGQGSSLDLYCNARRADGTTVFSPDVFYAVLPSVRLDLSHDEALDMCVQKRTRELRRTLRSANTDKVIAMDADALRDVLVAFAELRLALDGTPEWSVGVVLPPEDDPAGTDLGAEAIRALSEWLAAPRQNPSVWNREPPRQVVSSPGREQLEWRALTFNLSDVESVLRTAATPDDGNSESVRITGLMQASDSELRDLLMGDDVAWELWPSEVRVEGESQAQAAGRFVEHIRRVVPYAPELDDGITRDLFDLIGHAVLAQRLGAIRYQDNGNIEPVEALENFRRVPDFDEAGGGDPLSGLLSELRRVAAEATAAGGWQSWPEEFQGADANESALALFRHLRRTQPSPATAVVAFLDGSPWFEFDRWNEEQVTSAPLFEEVCFGDEQLKSAALDLLEEIQAPSDGSDDSSEDDDTEPAEPPPINHDHALVDLRFRAHRSPHGPAAYLADLYGRLSGDWKTGLGDDARRPDIAGTELTAGNAEVLVPEIDLVNEKLEAIASGNAPTARSTGGSMDERRRQPEHSTPRGDTTSWDDLSAAIAPLPLPYDRNLDAIRGGFRAAGSSRTAIFETLSETVSENRLAHLHRSPASPRIVHESFGLSELELSELTRPHGDGELAAAFGFEDGETDAEVVEKLVPLDVFLSQLELCRESLDAIVETSPEWLALRVDETTGRPLLREGDADPTPGALHRFRRHLRLHRLLEESGNGSPSYDKRSLERTSAIAEALGFYGNDGGSWVPNARFFPELGALRKLWQELANPHGSLWDSPHGGLDFPARDTSAQIELFAGLIGIDDADADAQEAWAVLQRLSGVNLAGPGDARQTRQALRLVEIAKRVEESPFRIRELAGYLGDPDVPDVVPADGDLFDQLSDEHTAYRSAYEEIMGEADSESLRRLLIDRFGYQEAAADEIVEGFGKVLSRGGEWAYGPVWYTSPVANVGNDPGKWKVDPPFVFDESTIDNQLARAQIYLTRPIEEEELIASLEFRTTATTIPAEVSASRAKRSLAVQPVQFLERMQPFLPDMGEAKRILFDRNLNEQLGWAYVQRSFEALIEVPVRHFSRLLAPSDAGSPSARALAERLLTADADSGSPSELWPGADPLPGKRWARLAVVRGSGLPARMWSFVKGENPGGDPQLERIDGNVTFTDENDLGTPFGWRRNTPDVYRLPPEPAFVFHQEVASPPPSPKVPIGAQIYGPPPVLNHAGFLAVWEGHIRIGGAGERQRLWFQGRFHAEADNSLHVRVNDEDVISIERGERLESGFIDLDSGFHKIAVAFREFGEFHENLNAQSDAEVGRLEEAKARLDLGFALTSTDEDRRPTPESFRRLRLEELFQGENDPLGISEYADLHRYLWRICSFCGKTGLLPEEIAFFAAPLSGRDDDVAGAALGGWDMASGSPVDPALPPVPDESFDLDLIAEPPSDAGSAGRRRALFDMWENIWDLVKFRMTLISRGAFGNHSEASGQLRTVCARAYEGSGWSTAPLEDEDFRAAEVLFGVGAGTFAAAATRFATGDDLAETLELNRVHLRNSRWLRRMLDVHDLLAVIGTEGPGDLEWLQFARGVQGSAERTAMLDWAHEHLPAGGGLATRDAPETALTDGLRVRGRDALLAYLRYPRGGARGRTADELDRALLLDVRCDVGRQVSRINSAVSSIQRFVREKQSEHGSPVDSDWEGHLSYDQWLHRRHMSLFPENYLMLPGSPRTVAFAQLEEGLRRDEISLRKRAGDASDVLAWLEDDPAFAHLRLEEEPLEQAAMEFEPGRGWLSGDLASGVDRGWQPGPNHMRRATFHEEFGAHWLFWLVPVTGYEEDVFERPYSVPDQDGDPGARLTPHNAARLAWSWKPIAGADWEPSQVSDEWVPLRNPGDARMTISEERNGLRISCSADQSFWIPNPSLPPASGDQEMAAAETYQPTWYGGLRSLGDAVSEIIAPPLPLPAVPSGPLPPFGFSDNEKSHHVPASMAIHLGEHHAFAEARSWLAAKLGDKDWNSRNPLEKDLLLLDCQSLLSWAEDLLRVGSAESSGQAVALLMSARDQMGPRPLAVAEGDGPAGTVATPQFPSAVELLNPRLGDLWDRLEDTCHQAANLRSLDGRRHPDSRESLDFYRTAGQSHRIPDVGLVQSPYRFTFLLAKALELVGEVRTLGGGLMAAIEKSDAEELALLRAAHEEQITRFVRDTQKLRWEESETQWRILRQNRFNTEFRKRFYQELVRGGLNGGETSHLSLMEAADALALAGQVVEVSAQAVVLIPDAILGGAGISSPVAIAKMPGGEKIARLLEFVAKVLHTLSSVQRADASEELTKGGYDRRRREWEHQRDAAGHEITALERQIDAAQQRMSLAKREVDQTERQLDQNRRVLEFAKDKFSNAQLYGWMRRELLALHEKAYRLAEEVAMQAQSAFRRECGLPETTFVEPASWSSRRDGLMAGERLTLALRRMEKSYNDTNLRTNELTKHVSLRLLSPFSLVTLLTTGRCEISIPEWWFDMDYPGHYLRRLKSVGLSLPCVVGPYQSVNATLTHLGSTIRKTPDVGNPCPGYAMVPGDSRSIVTHSAAEAVATTGAQNDSGLFELNFRDERYLPFEGHGAVSSWRIELPEKNNWFDIGSLSDAVLHLRYTSREGGEPLRQAAASAAEEMRPSRQNPGLKLLHLRHELAGEWGRLSRGSTFQIDFPVNGSFLWRRSSDGIRIMGLHVLVRTGVRVGTGAVRLRIAQGNDAGSEAASEDVALVQSGWSERCLYAAIPTPGLSEPRWRMRLIRDSNTRILDLFVLGAYSLD